jgi:hypothetical protein
VRRCVCVCVYVRLPLCNRIAIDATHLQQTMYLNEKAFTPAPRLFAYSNIQGVSKRALQL